MRTNPARTDGTEIRKLRIRRGLRLRQLAALAGISLPYLARIETGDRNGMPDTIVAIANALDVPIEQITAD